MAEEYKALTVVNLPFIDKRYNPGQMIPRSAFEENAVKGAALVDLNDEGDNVLDADGLIDYFTEWGTISEDPDAELHPAHRPSDPNKPNLATLVSQAQRLVNDLEEAGQPIPAKLRELAEISDKQVSEVDSGVGGDTSG